MVIVFTKFPVKVEFNEQYSAHLKEAVTKHQVESQAGFLEMKLLAPQHMPHISEANNFTIETRWEDMKSFLDYTRSDVFSKSHENLAPKDWFTGRPEVEVYETID
jgi:heme-degrading monooxygenase HmoA